MPRGSVGRLLTLSTLLLSVLGALVATWVQSRIEYQLERNELDAQVHRTAEAYLPRLILAIHQGDLDEAGSLLWEIRDLAGAANVTIRGATDLEAGTPRKTKSQLVEYRYPLNFERPGEFRSLGTLAVHVSLAALDQRLRDTLLITLATQALKVFCVTLFLLFLVRMLVTRHLRTLSHYARRLRLDRLDQVLYLHRGRRRVRDEFDDVVGSLNEMRVNLLQGLEAKRKAEEDLRRLNESLEKEVKEQTRALRMALAKAEDSASAKSRFLANMSHEMRTPLNGIIGLSQVLFEEPLTADQKLWARAILQSGEHLLELVNDLLDVTQVESGEFELAKGRVDLTAVATLIREKYQEIAARKGLSFSIACPDGLPCLRGDADRISQVIGNLVSNAIKFTERGSVDCSFEILEYVEGTCRLRVSVSDTGIGVAPERRRCIFEPFTQEDSSTTRQYGGLGLGLALSKMLAELMNGRVGLVDRRGAGSTFFFEWNAQTIRESVTAASVPAGGE